MTSGSDWAALISALEDALRPPKMLGVRAAAAAALERLSRTDCISVTATVVRRTLPLIGRDTPADRAAWLLVELAEELSRVDTFPSGANPASALVQLLGETGGAIHASGVDQAIGNLLHASAARHADSRARYAVTALWCVTQIMARAAWEGSGVGTQEGPYDQERLHYDWMRRREEWALICALLRQQSVS